MQAAAAGHVETVRTLLASGAKSGIRDEDGETAETLERNSGRDDVVALLEEHESAGSGIFGGF
jgi:ankyrin repeat protein